MITFTDENGNQVEFDIIEETRINGVNYILVTDDVENEEADAYILKDVSSDEDEDAVYEMVEDEYHPREVQTTTQFNPLYVSGGKTRTKKGASFRTHIKDVDIFDRKEIDEDEVDPETGFRLAMTPISVKIIRNR